MKKVPIWRIAVIPGGLLWLVVVYYHYVRRGVMNPFASFEWDMFFFLANKGMAITGMLLAAFSVAAGALACWWRLAKPWAAARREIGLASIPFILLHVLVTVTALTGRFPWTWYAARTLALVFAVASLVLLLAITAVSNRGARQRLGSVRWKRMQRLVYPALILGVAHFAAIGKPANWAVWAKEMPTPLPPGTLLLTVFLILLLLPRLLVLRAKDRRNGRALAMVLAMGMVGVAYAEETATPAAAAQTGVHQLPGMTVVGSPEQMRALPGSGQVIAQETITRQSYGDINRVLRRAPGVYVREEDGYGLFPYRFTRDAVDHEVTLGTRYHYDKALRFQWDDRYAQAASGEFIAVERGVPGTQDNRLEETSALALSLQDKLAFGRMTVTGGVRYENVQQECTDRFLNQPEAFGGKATAFLTAFNDLIVRESIGAGTLRDENIGKARSYGIELTLHADPGLTSGVKLFAGGQNILDKEYIVSRHPHGPRPGAPLFAYAGVEVVF